MSPQHTLHPKLRRLLPRPFRRGEGWGEGLLGVVYPAVLAVCDVVQLGVAPAQHPRHQLAAGPDFGAEVAANSPPGSQPPHDFSQRSAARGGKLG